MARSSSRILNVGSGSIRARFSVPPHGVEFAFKSLLLGHEVTRAGPEQLQAPNRAKESVRTYLDKVEQTALDDGDFFAPDLPAPVVDGSVPGPLLGCVQNLIYTAPKE